MNLIVQRRIYIFALFLFISCIGLIAQGKPVSVNLKNATLKELFSAIESQTSYRFSYRDVVIDQNKNINIKKENSPVSTILNLALSGRNLEYSIVSDQSIVISDKLQNKTSSTPKDQKKKISGIISDNNGDPIIGANVLVKGTTIGSITDIDGRFELEVPEKGTLSISYVGYTPQELTITQKDNYTIRLQEDAKILDEIVVVGYGIQKKVNLTGSVAAISAKELDSRPITSISAGLQGLVPGMTITQESGRPGGDGGKIRIRGVGTLNKSEPMILVDGIESTMDNLDQNDIETISVLKDAASAAIYGSKAANGVILITTKRGSNTKPVISYNSNFGWQKPTDMPEHLTSWEYADLYNEGLILDGKKPRFTPEDIQAFKDGKDPYKYPNTDWAKLLYKSSGFQHQHNINIAGGADKVRYMASVGYQQQEGVVKLFSKKQYNARTNLDIIPIKNLEVGLNLYFSNRDIQQPTNPYVGGIGQYFRLAHQMAPWIPYKDANGYYGTISDGNPIAWLEQKATIDKVERRFNGIASVKYTFIEGLSLKAIGSYRTNADDEHEFRKDIWYNPNKYQGPNKMYEKSWFSTVLNGDILANFDRTFGKHTISPLVGFHVEQYDYKYSELYRQNFPNNDLSDINAGSTKGQEAKGDTKHLNMISYFGRINYDFMGKYLLEANVRRDASSRFTRGHRWGTFPSFSAGWRISEEAFMEGFKGVLSNLKLRGSWGKLGNQSALEYYPAIPAIELGKDYAYPLGGTIQAGAAQKKAKKKTISWEKSRTWGIGLDFGLWSNLNVTLDYYNRLTTDMLLKVEAPATFGFEGYIDNVGKLDNKGFEVSVNYMKKIGKVDLNVGGNFTFNKNKLLHLQGDNYQLDGDRKINMVGYPVNSFYGYETAGLFKSKEEIDNWPKYIMSKDKVLPGDLKYVDKNGDNKITAEDRVVLGSTDPKYTFGFNISAAYQGFDCQLFMQGAAGVSGYMETEAIGEFVGDAGSPLKFWLDRWTPENPNATVPRIQNNNGISSPNRITSAYWVQNANYLRLKNIQLGYTFPRNWTNKLNISKLRIYYSGQNLLTFTSFLKGWDPEAPAGRGQYYPQVKVNSIGLNVTF